MTRVCQIIVLALLVMLWCGSAMAAPHAKYEIISKKIQKVDARSFEAPVSNTGRSFGSPYQVGSAANPGFQAGLTYYDYQHNGSVGRQVDEFDGRIQGSWMKAPGPSPSIRTVRWNGAPIESSPIPYADGSVKKMDIGAAVSVLGTEFAAVRPGYTNHRNRKGGKGVTLYHDAPESGGIQFWQIQCDATNALGLHTVSGGPAHQPPGYTQDAVIWPKLATSESSGGDTLVHVIGFWSGSSAEIWYWPSTVTSIGVATIGDPVMVWPVDANITGVVEAIGDTVYIVFGAQINSTNADVMYKKGIYSDGTGTVSWQPEVNVTNYSSGGPEGVYAELNAALDEDGQLHIIWNTIPASGVSFPTNLYHWDAINGIRLITSAGWRNKCVNGTENTGTGNGGGSNNLAIADMGLSVKPSGLGPGAGIADELIYAVWTQFGPTDNDCATVNAQGTLGGFVNAEVYISASSNGGGTWDRPQNMTQTVTPDCLPDDCLSESWSTVAPFADSGIYISYVRDTHAGAIVFGGGAWTESPYDFLAVEARLPVLEPVISVSPTELIELNAKTSGSSTTTFQVASVGNANLTYNIEVMSDNGGLSHVLVEGGGTYAGAITAGDPPDVITIEYDGLGLGDPSEHAWRLEVTSNDVTNDPNVGGTPIDVNLQVFVSDIWFTCDQDTLSTGQHRMMFSSCLEIGDQGSVGNGFYKYSDSADFMYSGSPVMTLLDGAAEVRAYRNLFMTLNERTRAINQSYRAQSNFNIARDASADVGSGLSSTTDSTINIDYEVTTYKDPGLQSGAVFKLTMTNVTGAPITDIDVGVFADIDCNPDAGENAGIASSDQHYIGGVGGALDTGGVFTANDNYFAFFHLPLDSLCSRQGAVAGKVVANPTYVHPENALNTDSAYSLFDWVGASGAWDATIEPDTPAVDIAVMMVSDYSFTLDPGVPMEWGYGLAVSDVSIADLETTIENLRVAANPICEGCLVTMTGDVNNNGSITSADIIYLVGFVFKGGPGPLPCHAAGDVNCNGSVTSADIIYLVGFVFKGGPPPCDVCLIVGSLWTCP